MHIYCVYPIMSKSPKQLQNYLKRAETRIVLIIVNGAFFSVYQHPIQPSCLHVHEESVYFSTSTEVCIVNLASELTQP
jgi:hypothetical protein